ncbi:MAG TPA: hypothetical protein VG276_28660 [Actinomycetes bacterium]|jgi:hypothetical protein|nr:hypothetical protein [Actinomycetes bacterium]
MALGASPILAAAESHALALGRFDRVNRHEPKSAPGNGLSAAIWVQSIRPVAAASGLDSTTARLELSVRVYLGMLHEPQDEIDTLILEAVDALMAAYSGDFELGGLVRDVDLLGEHGDPLAADAGYLEQDKKIYRVMVVTLPLLVNDLWSQAP